MVIFEEYWSSLFGTNTVGFIKNREGKTIPIRLGDRHIAEHFWRKGFDAATVTAPTADEDKVRD